MKNKRILAVELVLILFCVLQYVFPLHQYVYEGKDLTADSCTYLQYSEEYGLGCYLDQTFIADDSVLYITTPYVDLPRGSYDVTLVYSTDDPNQKYSANAKYATYFVVANKQGNRLFPTERERTYSFFSPTKVEEYQVHVDYSGEGYLFVESVTIRETNDWKNILLFWVVLLSLTVDGILFWYQRTPLECKREVRLFVAATAGLVICASTPLLGYFMMDGDDLIVHLNRIEAIKDSLLAGQFPNRVSPYWNNGYGYASAVFYGETLLYVPALLRLVGFTVQDAYKIYVVLINLATALVAYGCFAGILKNKKAAFLGSIAYVLAPYRLVCIYMRGAVGEYTAMLFLPLVFYGLYRICKSAEDEDGRQGWLPLLIGCSGILQCHVISVVIVSLFAGIFCLVFWKRMLRPRGLLQLVKAAAGTVLVSLWFLVPFADYYVHGYAASPWNPLRGGRMGAQGAFLSQMLTLFQDGYGQAYTVMDGSRVAGERNYALGCFVAVIFFYICLRLYRGRERTELTRIGDCCLGFGLLAAFMSTLWFPWDAIQQMNGIFRMITRNLQFPWRFLGISCLFFALLTGCFALLIDRAAGRQASYAVMLLLGLAVWVSADYSMYTYTKSAIPFYYSGEADLDSTGIGAGEYIPADTPIDFAESRDSVSGEGLTIVKEERQGGTHIVTCRNDGNAETDLDVPFLPYRGYRCYDSGTGQELEVRFDVPGKVRVRVPAGYDGTLRVRFEEPWYWRVCEAVSLISVAGWGLWKLRKDRKRLYLAGKGKAYEQDK